MELFNDKLKRRLIEFTQDNRYYQLILICASILYTIFGLFLRYMLNFNDPMPMQQRIIGASLFLVLYILSVVSKKVYDNLKILTDLVAYLALVHLTYVVYISDYRFELAVSLIIAVSIVNLVFKGEVHSLYANLILVFIILITLFYSEETAFNKALYFLAYLVTAALSYFISLQKRINEEKLQENKERLELAVEGANLGVWDWNIKSGEVIYDNKWIQALGYEEDDFDDNISQIINLVHPEDKKVFKNDINKLINGDKDFIRNEYRLKTKNGKWKWIKILGKTSKRNSNNEAVRAVGVHIDIDKQKRQEEKIKYLSFHDELTGLYNRRYFEAEMERLSNSRKYPVSIIIGDLDQLKIINDNFGHIKGDYYIQKASDIFKKIFRKEDIAARVGGDEFAVLLPETSEDAAKKICQRIKKEYEMLNKREDFAVPLSISLGFSTLKNGNGNLKDCYKKADHNMYKNKQNVMKNKNYY
jgi:diguanylate cyclase (GGDEF)-like protein/PAS domain S-box-containing protein